MNSSAFEFVKRVTLHWRGPNFVSAPEASTNLNLPLSVIVDVEGVRTNLKINKIYF